MRHSRGTNTSSPKARPLSRRNQAMSAVSQGALKAWQELQRTCPVIRPGEEGEVEVEE
jgi:hypothetical protein